MILRLRFTYLVSKKSLRFSVFLTENSGKKQVLKYATLKVCTPVKFKVFFKANRSQRSAIVPAIVKLNKELYA